MKQDIFGQALRDYWNGKHNASYTIRRDDDWTDEPQMVEEYFRQYPDWNGSDQKIVDLARGRILDIGAGAGRHALYLQNKGFEVYPIDISPGAVEVMRQRKIRNCLLMDLWHLDFSPCFFDTIILMFNGFGLAGTPKKAKSMLQHFANLAAPNGQLLMTILDPYLTENPAHLEYHDRNRKKGKPAGQIKIRLEYKNHQSNWFNLLLVSPQELKETIHDTGWQLVRIIRSASGPLYGAVLEKKH